MGAFFLYIIANILLIIFGYSVLHFYKGFREVECSLRLFMSFVVGIILNFVIFFLLGWSQVGFGFMIPLYILVGVGLGGYHLWKQKGGFSLSFPSLPKYEFRIKHVPLFVLAGFIVFRVFFSFFQAIHLPAYFDDEKGNWNLKSKVIYSGQSISLDPSDENTYVGGGGHKEYPLGFVMYKTYITQFLGYWSDALTALIHPLFFYVSIFLIVFGLTKSWPMRTIMLYFVTSIPLVSWHAGVSYYDLIIATELSLIYYFFFRYNETKNTAYLHMIVWMALLTFNTKNEGAILVFPSLLPLVYFLVVEKTIKHFKGWLWLFAPFVLAIPHLIFRAVYHLSFNPHSSSASYGYHSEALPLLKQYFFEGGSYNIFWYILPILLVLSYKKMFEGSLRFIFSSIFLFFAIALSVFLFTNNFQYLLDQTTIHRTLLIFMVPMMIFLLFVHEKEVSLLFKKNS